MEREKPNYYAVIPAEVRYCKGLPPNAKLMYGEITALCSTDSGCFARNKYFADLYDVDIRTIQKWINLLEEKGFIERSSPRMTDSGLREIKLRHSSVRDYERESYDEIFRSCNVDYNVKQAFIRFIKHCNMNGKLVTNDKLYDLIIRLDMEYRKNETAKVQSLDRAISKGYFDIAEDPH